MSCTPTKANSWQKCELKSAYDGTGNKVVSKSRDVTCIATPIDGEVAPYKNCNSDDKPDSTSFCDASDTKYYWKQNSNWSGCTALCNKIGTTQNTQEDIWFNPFQTVQADTQFFADACPVGQTSQTISGTEYKTSKCHQVIGNVDTVVADSYCSRLPAPYVPNRSCSRSCPCIDTGGTQ